MDLELSSYVRKKLLEMFWVIEYQAINDGLMDLNWWELVLVVFIDDSGEFGEVLANLSRTVANYQVEFVKYFLKKLVVALNILEQWFRRQNYLKLLLGFLVRWFKNFRCLVVFLRY